MTRLQCGLGSYYGSSRDTAECARLAEEAGWDGLFVGDAIWSVDPMVSLAAAAMVTSRLRLGTMVIPVPLRRPWKIASESAALDNLSGGRLILGLGTGAVFMGWQGFPDEVTDNQARAAMLDETIDILTLLYRGRSFDFDGRHYRVRLTEVDEQYYPPRPIQQPRIPIWVPGIWPRRKSMSRALRCEGMFVEKIGSDGPLTATPADVQAISAYVEAYRDPAAGPLDIVVSGKSGGLGPAEARDLLMPWAEAGATWWVEDLWEATTDQAKERIRQGPPSLH